MLDPLFSSTWEPTLEVPSRPLLKTAGPPWRRVARLRAPGVVGCCMDQRLPNHFAKPRILKRQAMIGLSDAGGCSRYARPYHIETYFRNYT